VTKTAAKEPEADRLVLAVTWESDHMVQQAKLAATEKKTQEDDGSIAQEGPGPQRSIVQLGSKGQLASPPPRKAQNNDRIALAIAPTGAGGVTSRHWKTQLEGRSGQSSKQSPNKEESSGEHEELTIVRRCNGRMPKQRLGGIGKQRRKRYI
jgi:hypothetical protein